MTRPCELTAIEARRLIGVKQLSPVELLADCARPTANIGALTRASG